MAVMVPARPVGIDVEGEEQTRPAILRQDMAVRLVGIDAGGGAGAKRHRLAATAISQAARLEQPDDEVCLDMRMGDEVTSPPRTETCPNRPQ